MRNVVLSCMVSEVSHSVIYNVYFYAFLGPCEAGHYCQGGSDSKVPSVSLLFPKNGACQVGHYCPEGTPSPVPCPVGMLRNTTGTCTNLSYAFDIGKMKHGVFYIKCTCPLYFFRCICFQCNSILLYFLSSWIDLVLY